MKIAEKIQKLIAKADGSTHPEEADAFMRKAHELMITHGLSLLDLGKLGDDPVGVDIDVMDISASYPWLRRIAAALAAYYGAEVVYSRGYTNNIKLSVAGRESARVTFMLMLPFVKRQVAKLCAESYNSGHYNSRMQAATAIGNAVAVRIAKMLPEVKQHEGTGVNALVPVDLIKQALDEAFPKMKEGKAQKVKLDSHARQQAEKVSLNRQAGSQKQLKLKAPTNA